jgi:hypothetical protein
MRAQQGLSTDIVHRDRIDGPRWNVGDSIAAAACTMMCRSVFLCLVQNGAWGGPKNSVFCLRQDPQAQASCVNPINLPLEMAEVLTRVSHVLVALDSVSSTSREIARRSDLGVPVVAATQRRNFLLLGKPARHGRSQGADRMAWERTLPRQSWNGSGANFHGAASQNLVTRTPPWESLPVGTG